MLKEIQNATASEPLTLDQEYEMQQSWRLDDDKLTFIICMPTELPEPSNGHANEIASMLGDVNLFISYQEDDADKLSIVGEVELMIALQTNQRRGYGREALLCFLHYIAKHQVDILQPFITADRRDSDLDRLSYLAVKIGAENVGSLHLFESLGFEKMSQQPNYFGEYELRMNPLSSESITALLERHHVFEYQEHEYK